MVRMKQLQVLLHRRSQKSAARLARSSPDSLLPRIFKIRSHRMSSSSNKLGRLSRFSLFPPCWSLSIKRSRRPILSIYFHISHIPHPVSLEQTRSVVAFIFLSTLLVFIDNKVTSMHLAPSIFTPHIFHIQSRIHSNQYRLPFSRRTVKRMPTSITAS